MSATGTRTRYQAAVECVAASTVVSLNDGSASRGSACGRRSALQLESVFVVVEVEHSGIARRTAPIGAIGRWSTDGVQEIAEVC